MELEAELLFTKKSTDKPSYTMQPYGVPSVRKGEFEHRTVAIRDARNAVPAPALDAYGFELVEEPTRVVSFSDDLTIEQEYYPEIESLICRKTGCRAVHIFDHTIRSSKPDSNTRGTAGHTHNDYTEVSLMKIWEGISEQYSEYFPVPRLMQVNVWRPLNEPVLVSPLTIVNGATVRETDFIACDIIYPDRTGEIYELAYDPQQDWYFYPQMRCNEALLIKGYDSCTDGMARFAPHTAFTHLAVDKRFRGMKLGAALLFNAIERAARSEIAMHAMIVEAKDEQAEAFYRHHGFATYGSASAFFHHVFEFGFSSC